jgi:DNA gyrase subunit B
LAPERIDLVRALHADPAAGREGHEGPRHAARGFELLDGDLMTLPITAVTQVAASHGQVYDFSVADDENFICGFGGIAACNTDADVDAATSRRCC